MTLGLGLGPVRTSTECGPGFKNIDLKTVDEVDRELDSVQLTSNTPLIPKLTKTLHIENKSNVTGNESAKKPISVKFGKLSASKIGSPRSDDTTSSKR